MNQYCKARMVCTLIILLQLDLRIFLCELIFILIIVLDKYFQLITVSCTMIIFYADSKN